MLFVLIFGTIFCGMVGYLIVGGIYHAITDSYKEAYMHVKEYIPLSFKAFMTYYTIDPSKYGIYQYPIYLEKTAPYPCPLTKHVIKLDLWSWKRYNHWRKHKERKEMELKMTRKYLEMVQNDIDILKRRAEREIDQAIDRANNISNTISEHTKHL